MRSLYRVLIPIGLVALAASCDSSRPAAPSQRAIGPASAAKAPAGIPSTAEIRFGIDEHGSQFPPADEHDQSGHASDHVYPRETVLARNGTVTFQIDAVHQVAVYRPGTEPEDIRVDQTTLEDIDLGPFTLPKFRINDPTNRIVLGPAQKLFEQTWTTPAGTFSQPGRYLVICTTLPHFVASNMWAWVTVK